MQIHRLVARDAAYLGFRFFQDFALIYPVYVIMFRLTGLSFVEIAQLLAIWAGASAVTELPSGVLADLWSRRKLLALALLLKTIGFCVWLLSPGFAGFAAGFVLWGMQEGLSSGVTEALLYDGLSEQERAEDYTRVSGLGTLSSRIAVAASMVMGAWVFSRSPSIALAASAAAMVVSAACALGIPERGSHRRTHSAAPRRGGEDRLQAGRAGSARSARKEISEALRLVVRTARSAVVIPGVARVVMLGLVAVTMYGILDEYDTIFAKLHGVPLAWVGVWGAVRFVSEGLGGLLAPRVSGLLRTGEPSAGSGAGNTWRLGAWTSCAGFMLLLGTLTGRWALLPMYFLFFGMMAAAEVVFDAYVQQRIASAGRATVGSAISLLSTVVALAILFLFGPVAEHLGLRAVFIVGALVTMLTGLGYTALERRARAQKTNQATS